PPMNFLEGTVASGAIDFGAFRLGLPSGHPARAMEGKKVTAGVRPEDIYDSANKCPVPVTDANCFNAQVDVLEKLGAEDTAYLDASGLNLTATLDPATRIEAGQRGKFAVDLERVHIFDSESEQAIR
ncbi:MAG TPA: hypothetical protein VNI20_10380, partial [Fimbriimonadaceae bacterium]|nr:hypothetical protein [Fimbriimonadaceae bacterium]